MLKSTHTEVQDKLATTASLRSASARAELYREYRQNSDLGMAENLLREGLLSFPGELALMIELAEVATDRKDWATAITRWSEIISVHGKEAPRVAFTRLSHACRRDGDLARAEQAANSGLEKYSANPYLLRELARVALARKDWPAAVERWTQMLGTKPGKATSEASAALIRAHRNSGHIAKAEATLLDAFKSFPRDVLLLAEDTVLENYRSPNVRNSAPPQLARPSAEIVVCVHNALDETRVCLDAVAAATKGQYFLTVVDDGSEVETNAYIQDFVAQAPNRRLLVNSTNQGYTKSANRGLRAARADWVILLNSDTIVTENWLAGLLDCALSDPAIRAVGPLSNAATFQSMPWTVGDGDGARPDQDAVQRIARRLSELSWSACPKVPMLNGFCLMLHKPTLGEIGYLDETNFPIGYGEENDLCLRMMIAGHVLAIADYVYVYHSRSASFGTKRKLLAENAFKTLRRLWPGYNYTSITQSIQDIPALAHLREAIW